MKKTIKPNYRQIAKYTEEEKTKLFKEGHIRGMSKIQKNKKRYTRKEKHKRDYQEER